MNFAWRKNDISLGEISGKASLERIRHKFGAGIHNIFKP